MLFLEVLDHCLKWPMCCGDTVLLLRMEEQSKDHLVHQDMIYLCTFSMVSTVCDCNSVMCSVCSLSPWSSLSALICKVTAQKVTYGSKLEVTHLHMRSWCCSRSGLPNISRNVLIRSKLPISVVCLSGLLLLYCQTCLSGVVLLWYKRSCFRRAFQKCIIMMHWRRQGSSSWTPRPNDAKGVSRPNWLID